MTMHPLLCWAYGHPLSRTHVIRRSCGGVTFWCMCKKQKFYAHGLECKECHEVETWKYVVTNGLVE